LRYLKGGKSIVYHAAALAIVHNLKPNKQKFFNNHTDDITAFAYWKGINPFKRKGS